ncbi:MAG: DNA polymerase III subunit alpha [Firmicutes bacterium]|nr:DNA polymerase III subunit alpha [Bacillota bacterium]
MKNFVHLHVHSQYSFLDGADTCTTLVARAASFGMPAIAITDHNNVSAMVELTKAAAEHGIKPICGTELTVRHGRSETHGGRSNGGNTARAARTDRPAGHPLSHLTLLAADPCGYSNICRILTDAYMSSPRLDPHASLEILRRHSGHIIALSGCRRGRVASLVAAGRFAEALATAKELASIFGQSNFYIELQHTLTPGASALNASLAELASSVGLDLVATNNVHYVEKPRFEVHDALTCVRTLTTLDDIHPERRVNAENYLKSSEEMGELFVRYPEATTNALVIAERCTPGLDLSRRLFPKYQASPGDWGCGSGGGSANGAGDSNDSARHPASEPAGGHSGGHSGGPAPADQSAAALLKRLTMQGAVERYGRITSAIQSRLDHELNIITTLGFEDYFLAVWDIACWARSQGIRYAGRGSAADSAVAYCLRLTNVDSIARGLLFERFMSLERAQKPDIDIDFESDRRDDVARYVYQRYGEEHVASVCTFNTFQGRSAVRDFGRVLGFPQSDIDRLAKTLPHVPADAVRAAFSRYPEMRDSGIPAWKYELLLTLAESVAGYPRHIGTHLGGLVISSEPLTCVTPLQMAAKGVAITQFDKGTIEDLGLIKLDLLSLRTLGAVEHAVDMVRGSGATSGGGAIGSKGTTGAGHTDARGVSSAARSDGSYPGADPSFDFDRIPHGDRATYEMLNAGETIGVFQLESPAQRALQTRLGADSFEDIVASVALIRPGPIQGNMVEPFIARRRGEEEITYVDPRLAPILDKTYGVVLYQEQVIQIATTIAGFTPGEADRLRKVMTHFRSMREMEEIGRDFVAKAVAGGTDPKVAETVFSYIVGYAGYGFCEAHAAAFADTAYRTAYMVRHYPAHFYAAVLSAQPMGFYSPRTLLVEAKRRGVRVLPLDINHSHEKYSVETIEEARGKAEDEEIGPAIRVGLMQVKGISKDSIRRILAAREESGSAAEPADGPVGGRESGPVGGPFRSALDFLYRVDIPRDIVQSLVLAGAFDSVEPNRRALAWRLARLTGDAAAHRASGAAARESGQAALGGTFEPHEAYETYVESQMPDFTEVEKFKHEMSILGFCASHHAMELFRPALARWGVLTSREAAGARNGQAVRVAGLVVRPHRPPTRSGKTVVFLSLEDELGLTDVTVFESIYQKYGALIYGSPALLIAGTVSRRGDGVSVIARSIQRLGRRQGRVTDRPAPGVPRPSRAQKPRIGAQSWPSRMGQEHPTEP